MLADFEIFGIFDNGGDFVGGHSGFNFGELSGLSGFAFAGDGFAGRERHKQFVRIVDKIFPQQIFKVAAVQAFLDRFQIVLVAEINGRVAAVEPGFEPAQAENQTFRHETKIGFAQTKFKQADGRFEQSFIDTVGGEIFHFGENEVVEFIGAVEFGAVERDAEGRLSQIFVHTGVNVLAELRIKDSFAERRGGRREQRVVENFEPENRGRIGNVAHKKVQFDESFFGGGFFLANRINFVDAFHFGEGRLNFNFGVDFDFVEPGKIFAVEIFQLLVNVNVAVKVNVAVGRVIKFLVEGGEIRLREIRNGVRVAAALKAVAGIWENFVESVARQNIFGRREGAFHFVVDDAAVSQRRAGIFNFVVPALLHENFGRSEHGGIENGVEVNIFEVAEIFGVAARHGINCFVGISHGVQKRVERALDKFDERFFERIFLRAAKRAVFDDMSDAGIIFGRRAEGDIKNFVVIVGGDVKEAGAGLDVFKFVGVRADFGDFGNFIEAEAVARIVNFQIHTIAPI